MSVASGTAAATAWEGASAHLMTIPACGALGVTQIAREAGAVRCTVGQVRASRTADGRVAAGAALLLADQATAQGIFATLDAPVPMMTMGLRIDWLGDLPRGRLDCVIDAVTREGALALVRGRLLGNDERAAGAVTARYLIGAMPGGQTGMGPARPEAQPFLVASFEDYARLDTVGEHAWRHDPGPEHVGAPLPAYHGGVIAALLDQAALCTAGEAMVRADTDVRFLAPGRADRPMVLTARALRSGRRAATIDVEARQDDGATLVAAARCLFVAPALRDCRIRPCRTARRGSTARARSQRGRDRARPSRGTSASS